jgi:hypothetical protein
MIDDMTALKQAMGEMDAEDPAVAEAAKDRAARILGDARLSFSKMAELIEQRRLLLRPKIVANIKRMDQPAMLGDAAFRDAGSALRREGQTFRQIAEAIELNGGTRSRYVDPVQTSEALQADMAISEPAEPMWLHALALAARIIFFPIRHPLRFFTVALLAFVLFNTVRGFVGFGQQVSGFVDVIASARQRVDKAMSAFVDERSSQQRQEAAASPTPEPTPSAGPITASATPPPTATATPATPTIEAAPPPAPSPAAPAAPPAPTPPLDATRPAPSRSAANDRSGMAQPRDFANLMSEGLRRKSRSAGPCIGGTGGCYWGGGRY